MGFVIEDRDDNDVPIGGEISGDRFIVNNRADEREHLFDLYSSWPIMEKGFSRVIENLKTRAQNEFSNGNDKQAQYIRDTLIPEINELKSDCIEEFQELYDRQNGSISMSSEFVELVSQIPQSNELMDRLEWEVNQDDH
jgi:hypothetical protein